MLGSIWWQAFVTVSCLVSTLAQSVGDSCSPNAGCIIPSSSATTNDDWKITLRMPECSENSSSWASAYNTAEVTSLFNETLQKDFYITNATYLPLVTKVMTFPGNPTTTNPYFCCGDCFIHWGNVKVLYWPKEGTNTECLRSYGPNAHRWESYVNSNLDWYGNARKRRDISQAYTRNHPGKAPSPQQSWVAFPSVMPRKMDGFNTTRTFVGSNNFTYTSPYIYYEVPLITADDNCGTVGPWLQSKRFSLLPESVSSVVPLAGIDCFGAVLHADHLLTSSCSFVSQSFNFADIPCPPESLREWGSHSFIYDPASAYLPLLAPHPELTLLDPSYSRCSPMFGWDPFEALTSADAMITPSTLLESTKQADAAPGPSPPTMFAPTSASDMTDPFLTASLILPASTFALAVLPKSSVDPALNSETGTWYPDPAVMAFTSGKTMLSRAMTPETHPSLQSLDSANNQHASVEAFSTPPSRPEHHPKLGSQPLKPSSRSSAEFATSSHTTTQLSFYSNRAATISPSSGTPTADHFSSPSIDETRTSASSNELPSSLSTGSDPAAIEISTPASSAPSGNSAHETQSTNGASAAVPEASRQSTNRNEPGAQRETPFSSSGSAATTETRHMASNRLESGSGGGDSGDSHSTTSSGRAEASSWVDSGEGTDSTSTPAPVAVAGAMRVGGGYGMIVIWGTLAWYLRL